MYNDEDWAKMQVLAPKETSIALDWALGIDTIELRLPIELLKNIEILADLQGTGVKPFIRLTLEEFVQVELDKLAQQ